MSSLTPDILVTSVYFSWTLLLAEGGRRLGRFLFSSLPLLETALEEAIAAFELCAICYEINILLEYPAGTFLYALYLFVASIWWVLAWENVTAAPYTFVVDILFGQQSLSTAAILIPAQLAGGLVFYQFYIQPLWQLGFGQIHVERTSIEVNCFSDIQVAVPLAAFVEGAGVFITLLAGKIAASQLTNTVTTAAVEAFVSTALVVAAMNITGGYYNPVLATATQFGCFGTTPLEHFCVYWIGEAVGAILAHVVWQEFLAKHLTEKSKTD